MELQKVGDLTRIFISFDFPTKFTQAKGKVLPGIEPGLPEDSDAIRIRSDNRYTIEPGANILIPPPTREICGWWAASMDGPPEAWVGSTS